MLFRFTSLCCLAVVLFTQEVQARTYAGLSGLAATADTASTAATNPAGITRFSERANKIELNYIRSETTWESELSNGAVRVSEDDGDLVVPSGYFVMPINDKYSFSFTVLGYGYSEDFGDWPGRYVIESYDALSVSAYPSIAYKVNDKLSLAASLSIAYATFEQERRVANLLDPGFGDGSSSIEADGIDVGFGLSMLYEFSERTRFGLVYNSELDPTQDGDLKLSGLGPNTEAAFEANDIIGADVEIKSTTPQSLLAGIYHEFDNNHALTVDLAWSDFSEFELSEYYFNESQIVANETEWEDVWALSASYGWYLNDRWYMSVGGFVTDDLVEDDERPLILRLDAIWSAGVAFEWQWTDNRTLEMNFNYMSIDDAPTSTPEIPVIGGISGKYTDRDYFLFRIGVSWGGL